MNQYVSPKFPQEIIQIFHDKNWTVHMGDYNEEDKTEVSVEFSMPEYDVKGTLSVNLHAGTFNGNVSLDGANETVFSGDTTHEGEPWFNDMLDIIHYSEGEG